MNTLDLENYETFNKINFNDSAYSTNMGNTVTVSVKMSIVIFPVSLIGSWLKQSYLGPVSEIVSNPSVLLVMLFFST